MKIRIETTVAVVAEFDPSEEEDFELSANNLSEKEANAEFLDFIKEKYGEHDNMVELIGEEDGGSLHFGEIRASEEKE